MANHVRRQLREAVGVVLTGLATTGANVFQSRKRPLDAAAMPGLLIFTTHDDSQDVTVNDPAVQERAVEINIEGYVVANADLDDVLDEIAKEVETAIGSGVTAGGKFIPMQYGGSDEELDESGERPTGSVTLRYKAKLFTSAGAPDVFS